MLYDFIRMHGAKSIKTVAPICCTMLLFFNYCSDVFRPQLLAIFRELTIFSICVAYGLNLLWWRIYICDENYN
jgi:hypothetical protein